MIFKGIVMKAFWKFAGGLVGAVSMFTTAQAATVTIDGVPLSEANDFATGIEVTSGNLTTFGGASDITSAIQGANLEDGVRCADEAGCSFKITFDQGVGNWEGVDFAIYGVGIGAPGSEVFDLAMNGVRLSNLSLQDTGETVGRFGLSALYVDLSDLGVEFGAVVNTIKIIVNPGTNPEEFAAFAALNEAVPVPLPAGFLLFLGGAAGLFGASRKKAA